MWCKTCRPCIGIIVVCRRARPNFFTLRKRPAVTLITVSISTGCAVPRNRTITTNSNCSCNNSSSNNTMPTAAAVVVIIMPTDCGVRNGPDVIAACPIAGPASRSTAPPKLTSWTLKSNRFSGFLLLPPPPMTRPTVERHWIGRRLNDRVRPTRTQPSSSNSTNNSNRTPELSGSAFAAEASTSMRY